MRLRRQDGPATSFDAGEFHARVAEKEGAAAGRLRRRSTPALSSAWSTEAVSTELADIASQLCDDYADRFEFADVRA